MNIKHFIKFWLPVILYMIFIVYLSSLEFPEKPKVHVADRSFKVSDIVLHVLEYGLLSVVLFRAFHNSPAYLKEKAIHLTLIVAFLFGVFDEVHQTVVPTRFFEVKDLISNTVGSFIILLTRKIKILRR